MARLPDARRLAALSTGVAALALAACGGGGSTTVALPGGCREAAKPPPRRVHERRPPQTVRRTERLTAAVETSCGTFRFSLDARDSPRTVNSFVHLARRGVYDETTFHRIVPDFLIQGGDPLGTGRGGPGYTVQERPPPGTQYRRGTVAMARAAIEPPGRSGSQFFVVTAADAGLPPTYALLGRVSRGQDVVRRIASLGDPASGQAGVPLATVVIRRIVIR